MDEQTTVTVYERPALVDLGEFGEDTLGGYGGDIFDGTTFFNR